VNITDAVGLLNWLFLAGAAPDDREVFCR